jgi:hypothetical protein
MSWNPFSKSNQTYNTQDNPGKKKLITIAVVSVVLVLGIPVFVALRNRPDDYTRSATEAARKVAPHAKVRNLKVAGGFAIATVSDSTAEGQLYAGNMTIFKINEDKSMTQIASGSSFTPLDLLELGIPLETQVELVGGNMDQIVQTLAGVCGYNGIDAPGYIGFDSSFEPDKWEIDSGMLSNLTQVLTDTLSNKNAAAKSDEKIVCVRATKNNSNAITDTKTYISTFTLELQFITRGGAITTHVLTFSIGPKYYQSYTLDGQKLTYIPNQNYIED